MKRLHKTTAVCGLMALALTLSGCGAGARADSRPMIGFTNRFIAGNSWLATLAHSAASEGAKRGYRVQTADAQGNAVQQIEQIRNFINQGAKAVIVEPVDDRAVAGGIREAERAHVPVIMVNDQVAPDLAKRVACNIHDDAAATAELVGETTAKAVAARHQPSDTVKLYVQALFPQELVTETRQNGFMNGWNRYFRQHPGPKTVLIPNNYGKALPDATLTAMRNTLTAHPDVNVIFNETDVVTPAVQQALKDAGLMKPDGSTNVILASFDGGMDVVRSMADNPKAPMVADGLNQPPTQAAMAVQEAIAAAQGKKTGQCNGSPAERVLPPLVVTPQNAKNFVDPSLAFAGGNGKG
ncbi:sugar ABC transporter substrate-binding protein [Streptomyces sp. NPDC056580]|uniref:sugar ABC transporter substrate-binding protein n=1 Tax=Streptomyces sp. NPDC056580 TaxID=3345872 RepID=UPI0036A2D8A9